MLLIGLSGKKGSGKDTVFSTLASKHDNVYRFAFADAVKDYANKYFGVTPLDNKEDVRFIYQGIGQMLREEVSKEYWISKVEESILNTEWKPKDVCVITDVRYMNEIRWILRLGGTPVRVLRDTHSTDTHPSETEMDEYDFEYTINNNGTIEDLVRQVDELAGSLLR